MSLTEEKVLQVTIQEQTVNKITLLLYHVTIITIV